MNILCIASKKSVPSFVISGPRRRSDLRRADPSRRAHRALPAADHRAAGFRVTGQAVPPRGLQRRLRRLAGTRAVALRVSSRPVYMIVITICNNNSLRTHDVMFTIVLITGFVFEPVQLCVAFFNKIIISNYRAPACYHQGSPIKKKPRSRL